jgi:hypothetical protein
MNALKTMLRLLRRGLMWLLIVYWVVFIGYTIKSLIQGGPEAVVRFYRHIFYMHAGALQVPVEWNWGPFLAAQAVYLAITLALILFERRAQKHVAGTAR